MGPDDFVVASAGYRRQRTDRRSREAGLSRISIVHCAVPGRLRLRVPGLFRCDPLGRAIVSRLRNHADIREVSADARTGNVLVRYTPGLSVQEIVAALEQVLAPESAARDRADARHPLPRIRVNDLQPAEAGPAAIVSAPIHCLPMLLLLGSEVLSTVTRRIAGAATILGRPRLPGPKVRRSNDSWPDTGKGPANDGFRVLGFTYHAGQDERWPVCKGELTWNELADCADSIRRSAVELVAVIRQVELERETMAGDRGAIAYVPGDEPIPSGEPQPDFADDGELAALGAALLAAVVKGRFVRSGRARQPGRQHAGAR